VSVPLELVSYPRFLLFAALWKSTVMRFIIYPIVFLYILTGVLSLPLISKGDHDMYVTHIWLLVLKIGLTTRSLNPISQTPYKWLGTRDAILADEFVRRAGKITFSKHAHAQLDALGLHGKARKSAKKYNRKLVENHMKNVHGAHSATIE